MDTALMRRATDAPTGPAWDGEDRRTPPLEHETGNTVNVYPHITIAAPKLAVSHVLTLIGMLAAVALFLVQNERRLARMEVTLESLNVLVQAHMNLTDARRNNHMTTPLPESRF